MRCKNTEEQIKECRENWFKNHKAHFYPFTSGTDICGIEKPITVNALTWRNPEHGNYNVNYFIHNNTLMVHGDIGEATYCWGSPITWNFLSGCNLDYFLGKCQASEAGRDFKMWDENEAFNRVTEYMDTWTKEQGADGEKEPEYFNLLRRITAHTSHDDFDQLIREAWDDINDCELASMFMEFGNVPHPRAIGHWVGIRMATEQIAAQINPQLGADVTGTVAGKT